jgi:hypothetical protein
MVHWVNSIFLGIIFVGCIVFLVASKRSLVFSSLALTSLSAFAIVMQFGSTLSAVIRLTAMLSSLLAIFVSMREQKLDFTPITRNAAAFRVVAYLIMLVLIILVAIRVSSYLGIAVEIVLAGLLLVFCGLLQLGISLAPGKVILGIILFFFGFATVYSVIETSLLVNGLLSAVVLLLGGLGTYLVVKETRGGEAS